MGELSQTTLSRLYVLALVGSMPDGVWGRLRLQKMNFFAEKDAEVRPFTIIRGPYGQFSDELADTVEQLLAANLLTLVTRHDRATGEQLGANEYRLTTPAFAKAVDQILAEAAPGLYAGVRDARRYGLLPEPKLREEAYRFFDNDLPWGTELISADVPERIEVKSLSDDECEDLEASLEPTFIQGARALVKALGSTEFRLDEVPTFDVRAASA